MTPEQVRGDRPEQVRGDRPEQVRADRPSLVTSAPLIITAELPADLQAWADGLRRAHFPPERNHLAAHVTLFHTLPPGCEGEARAALANLAKCAPPAGRLAGLMPLGGGTALRLQSQALLAMRAELAERFHGLLTTQDQAPSRLHVTIQNKVAPTAAKALQAELAPLISPRDFAFAGLALHAYRGGPWQPLGRWPFRG